MSRGFTRSAILLASVSAIALSSGAALADGIETVVVTAQKKTELLEKVPVSIKVLSGDLLDKVQVTGLSDIVKMVPSLTMTNISRGGNQVQIRGLGSNVVSVGTVAIYNDGVIPPSRVQSSGAFSEQDNGVYDLERVEVLRGPQGTLYGEGSFGGVINFISKKPNPEKFEASGSATWFDVAHGSSDNHDLSGMINVPLAPDLAVRGVAYDYAHAGYIDAVNILPVFFGVAPTEVFKDANFEHVTGGRVSIAYTPSDDFDATLILKHDQLRKGTDNVDAPLLIPTVNAIAGTAFPERYSYAIFSDDFGSKSLLDQAIFQLNTDIGIGHLSSVTGYGWNKADGNVGTHAKAIGYSEEIRLASNTTAEDPFSWIVGAYARSALRNVDLNISTYTGPFTHDHLQQKAVFGQAYWQFIPDWTLTLGARYEEQNSNFASLGTAAVVGKFSSFIPKVSLSWQMDDDTLAYATIAKGFRAGGTNPDESLGTDPTYRPTFAPDTIWNYELGAKKSFWDRMLTVNAAAFYIDWSDVQIDRSMHSLINPPLAFIVVNGDKAHSYGIEADFYLQPSDDWDIGFGGSLVNAEYDNGTIDSATGGLGVPLRGQKLPGSPSALFNASVEKRFQINADLQAYLRGEYNYRGSSFGDVPNTIPDPTATLASGLSQNINLRAGVRADVWEIQAFVTNLTDRYQSTYAFEWPAAFADVHAVTQPRTIGINLKMHTD